MDKKFLALSTAYVAAQFFTSCPFRGTHLIQGIKTERDLLGNRRRVRVVAGVRNKVSQAPYIPSPPAGLRWEKGRLVHRHAGR